MHIQQTNNSLRQLLDIGQQPHIADDEISIVVVGWEWLANAQKRYYQCHNLTVLVGKNDDYRLSSFL